MPCTTKKYGLPALAGLAVMLLMTIGFSCLALADAVADSFIDDLRNSRQVTIYPDNISIYLKQSAGRDQVFARTYAYIRLRGDFFALWPNRRPSFRLHSSKGQACLIIGREKIPVSIMGLPPRPSVDRRGDFSRF